MIEKVEVLYGHDGNRGQYSFYVFIYLFLSCSLLCLLYHVNKVIFPPVHPRKLSAVPLFMKVRYSRWSRIFVLVDFYTRCPSQHNPSRCSCLIQVSNQGADIMC